MKNFSQDTLIRSEAPPFICLSFTHVLTQCCNIFLLSYTTQQYNFSHTFYGMQSRCYSFLTCFFTVFTLNIFLHKKIVALNCLSVSLFVCRIVFFSLFVICFASTDSLFLFPQINYVFVQRMFFAFRSFHPHFPPPNEQRCGAGGRSFKPKKMQF